MVCAGRKQIVSLVFAVTVSAVVQQGDSFQSRSIGTSTAARDSLAPAQHGDFPSSSYYPSPSQNQGQHRSLSISNESLPQAKLDLQSYHLLWSPGAWKKVGIGLLCFTVLNQLLLQTNGLRYLSTLVSHSHLACCLGNETGEDSWWYKPILSLMVNMGVPLLASSCCLIQLIINIVAGGCAGFNTVLGPIRPFFVAFLLHLTINTARLSSLQWYGKTALRWLIALLPEMVHVWNNAKVRREKPPLQHHQQQPSSYTSEPNAPTMEVKVEIPTMGCVACINKIDAALRQVPYVMEASSSLNPFGAKGDMPSSRLQYLRAKPMMRY